MCVGGGFLQSRSHIVYTYIHYIYVCIYVCRKNGHCSLKALRSYERTDTRMQMAIDAVISNTTNKFAVQESQSEPELTKSVLDKVSNVNHDQENGEVTATKPLGPAGHKFSGVMNNCTINISCTPRKLIMRFVTDV